MIDHVGTNTTDFARAQAFYDATLGALGYVRNSNMEWKDEGGVTRHACSYGTGRKPTLWLAEVGSPPTPRHIAFVAKDRSAVDAFHAAGLALGAKDNGPPGLREHYHPNYYGAFLIDPDGNNVEAVCHFPP
jgi:catechol 2,3-dioxygenase-like lactoylglutathione lyase family enzyme